MTKFKELIRKAIDEVEEILDDKNVNPETNEQNAKNFIREAIDLRKKERLNASTVVGGAYVDGQSNVANTGTCPVSAARRIDRKYKDYKI